MLGIRTPVKKNRDNDTQPPLLPQKVRRSIGEWETGKIGSTTTTTSPIRTARAGPSKSRQGTVSPQETATSVNRRTSVEAQTAPPKAATPTDRLAQARACLNKAKLYLGEARNLKTEIKLEVIKALERLYQIVKEAEAEKKKENRAKDENMVEPTTDGEEVRKSEECRVMEKLEENSRLITENGRKLDEIRKEMEKQGEKIDGATYASITANPPKKIPETAALHSIIVSSRNDMDTGEEILNEIRETVSAKDGWVRIEKVRKAKDRKVIMGCRTMEDRNKLRERIEKGKGHLVVEEAKNRDPLLIVKDVLLLNSDEDVLVAIRNQNKDLFLGLVDDEDRLEIKYKKRARNPHTQHIVMSTSPTLWSRATEMGSFHIDLQRVRVADQSPLVQCTRCLGYGHGRRFCTESADACSHCGGPHLSADCADRLAGKAPTCRNCLRAKLDTKEHNAFSNDCQIRRKWDEIARSTVAYC